MKQRKSKAQNLERLVDFYLLAKRIVVDEGFSHEILWQQRIQITDLSEDTFLREAAWVVLSSGMREIVIRQKFLAFSKAFYNWVSAQEISEKASECRASAHKVFGHRGKINSIIEIAERVANKGFEDFKGRIRLEGIEFLGTLPFMGPATTYHLAKNIGLDVVKPDRHLVRISALAGYKSPSDFCAGISNIVGDRLSVVDLVVWRYATLNPGYRGFLSSYLH